MMKRFALLLTIVLFPVSCIREEYLACPDSGERIAFVLKPASDTKAVPVERLDSFNVLATVSGSGAGKKGFYSAFSNSGGIFRSSAALFWPSTDPGYRFYASNVEISAGSSARGPFVYAGGCSDDIVCAYIANPGYRTLNQLEFKPILARVEYVNPNDFAGFDDVDISLRYADTGNYYFRDSSWSDLIYRTCRLSLKDNNDLWIIPGSYMLTVSFRDAAGLPRVLSAQQDFVAGRVNNINCLLGSASEVVVDEDVEYEAPTFTLSSVPDVSASGGVSAAPAVSGISQRYRVVRRYADGSIKGDSDADWMKVESVNPLVQYSHSPVSGFSSIHLGYSCPDLGTALTVRRQLGSVYVKVTANGVFRVCETPVFQQANSMVIKSVSLIPEGSWDSCSSAGAVVKARGYALREYTSNATENACITTDAVLDWNGNPSWIMRRQTGDGGYQILQNGSTAPRKATCTWSFSGFTSPALTLLQNGIAITPGGDGDDSGTGGHDIHY